ncbi:MAG: glutathione S-transferase N-terminal domain-containing protein, partial [Alphaproteobacteria bacterium]|nr:glutathione S-transferase N-terminal domain-containing protein [Alphaproteobacteria bacterium]
MRARLSLNHININVLLREIELKNKPEHMLEISPKGTVPVLQLPDGLVIDESLDVMKWAFSQDKNLKDGTPTGWPRDDLWALISKI